MIFRKFHDSAAINRKAEACIYEAVIEEIKSGIRKEGLWAQALVKAQGSERRAEAAYIELRARAMKDDVQLFESFRREMEKRVAKSAADASANRQSRSHPEDASWRCAKCGGRVGINYGSAREIICKKCANAK